MAKSITVKLYAKQQVDHYALGGIEVLSSVTTSNRIAVMQVIS